MVWSSNGHAIESLHGGIIVPALPNDQAMHWCAFPSGEKNAGASWTRAFLLRVLTRLTSARPRCLPPFPRLHIQHLRAWTGRMSECDRNQSHSQTLESSSPSTRAARMISGSGPPCKMTLQPAQDNLNNEMRNKITNARDLTLPVRKFSNAIFSILVKFLPIISSPLFRPAGPPGKKFLSIKILSAMSTKNASLTYKFSFTTTAHSMMVRFTTETCQATQHNVRDCQP